MAQIYEHLKEDLNQDYTHDKNILEPYSFGQLLLEIHCNLSDENLTIDSIKKQAIEVFNSKAEDFRAVLASNLENIFNYEIQYRKNQI